MLIRSWLTAPLSRSALLPFCEAFEEQAVRAKRVKETLTHALEVAMKVVHRLQEMTPEDTGTAYSGLVTEWSDMIQNASVVSTRCCVSPHSLLTHCWC